MIYDLNTEKWISMGFHKVFVNYLIITRVWFVSQIMIYQLNPFLYLAINHFDKYET